MEELNDQDMDILMFLVHTRLKYEARRKPYLKDGIDLTSLKVRELSALHEKLERIRLAQ